MARPKPKLQPRPNRTKHKPPSTTTTPSTPSGLLPELTSHPDHPLPPGYHFVPKGNVYITKHCRSATHAARRPLYVVLDRKTNKPLGLRCPASVYHSVLAQHKATAPQRAAAVQKRDEALEEGFGEAVLREFPKMPRGEVERVVKHALKKGSRRVGRAVGNVGLEERVRLAVRAHIRHVHTEYDGWLRKGVSREVAREKVWERLNEVAREWGGRGVKAAVVAAPAQGGDKKGTKGKGGTTGGAGKAKKGGGVAKRAAVQTTTLHRRRRALALRTKSAALQVVTSTRVRTRSMGKAVGGEDNSMTAAEIDKLLEAVDSRGDVFTRSEESDDDSDYSE